MTVTHKKAAQILKHWNLEGESVTDIYYEGTGNKNDSACYVGEKYVLKFSANLRKLKMLCKIGKLFAIYHVSRECSEDIAVWQSAVSNAAFGGGVDAVFQCGYREYVFRRYHSYLSVRLLIIR